MYATIFGYVASIIHRISQQTSELNERQTELIDFIHVHKFPESLASRMEDFFYNHWFTTKGVVASEVSSFSACSHFNNLPRWLKYQFVVDRHEALRLEFCIYLFFFLTDYGNVAKRVAWGLFPVHPRFAPKTVASAKRGQYRVPASAEWALAALYTLPGWHDLSLWRLRGGDLLCYPRSH